MQWRKMVGLSRATLARETGFPAERLASYELGRVPLSFDVFMVLWIRHRINAQWLAEDVGPEELPDGSCPGFRLEGDAGAKFSTVFREHLATYFYSPEGKAEVARAWVTLQFQSLCIGLASGRLVSKKQIHKLDRAAAMIEDAVGGGGFELRPIVRRKNKIDISARGDEKPFVQMNRPRSWPELRARISEMTARRGERSALAKKLGVSRQVVGGWLSGAASPDSNTTIQLLDWTRGIEPQPKETASALRTPKRQKVQKSKLRHAKEDPDPPAD